MGDSSWTSKARLAAMEERWESTSAGVIEALAPGERMIWFWPEGSMRMRALPVGLEAVSWTRDVSMPKGCN